MEYGFAAMDGSGVVSGTGCTEAELLGKGGGTGVAVEVGIGGGGEGAAGGSALHDAARLPRQPPLFRPPSVRGRWRK